MRKIFLFIAFISMYFLGQAQYAPTSSKTRFVNGIGLSTKDTASLSNAGDTLAMIVGKDSLVYFKYKGYWKPIAYNSSLNSYVKYSDTSSMLSPYQRSFSAMKYSDTATMLSSYYNKTATNSLLNTKLNTSDTATMLSGYKTYYPRNAISGGTGISYNPSTGVITNTSSGTVTSVATNNGSGITGGTITTSGTIAADTSILATRLRVQKGIDSLGAAKISGSGSGNYVAKFTGVGVTIGNSTMQDDGSKVSMSGQLEVGGYVKAGTSIQSEAYQNLTGYTGLSLSSGVGVPRVLIGIPTDDNTNKLQVQGGTRITGQLTLGSTITNGTYTYTLPSATGTIALVGGSGVGTVTSVATDATMTGGTITTTGTLKVDTTVMATRLRVQKGIDSVNANVNLRVKYSDTATMLSNYYNKTATDSKLALKLNISDTATMLSPYARTLALGGYIPYTGATSAIDLNAKTVVNISHLGINTTSVPTILLRAIGDNNSSSRIAMRGYSSDANSSSIRVTKFRGTVAAPQAPQSGDGLGKFELAGYGTTSSDGYPQASFEGIATENWGATARGAKVQVKVTPNTTITQAIALTINQDKSAVFENSITGTSLIKTGGTSSQFLKADGSVDANAYLNISDTATMLSGYKTYYPRASLSAGTGITYNASTGVITNSSPSTGGTVTSVATNTGSGITGGTITTSGTIAADTSVLATRLRVQKGIDSLGAAKQNAGTYVTSVTGTSPIVSSGGTTPAISIPAATTSVNGYLTSTDWNTFNGKQNALTNPVTGTGTTNYLPKFTGASTIGNSGLSDDGTLITTAERFSVNVPSLALLSIANGGASANYFRAANTYFQTVAGGELLYIHSAGVSIGNTNTTYKLDVNGTSRFSNDMLIQGSSGADIVFKLKSTGSAAPYIRADLSLSSYGGFALDYTGTNYWYIGALNGDITSKLSFYSAGAVERFTIASTGAATFSSSVTAGGDILVPYDTDRFIGARYSGTYYNGLTLNGGTRSTGVVSRSGDTSDYIWFGTNAATERMRITNSGNLLIGTTTDNGDKLYVNGTLSIAKFNATASSGGYITIQKQGTDQLYVGSSTAISGVGTNADIWATSGNGLSFYTNGSTSNFLKLASTGAATFSSTLGINGVADNIKSGTYTPTLTKESGSMTSISAVSATYTRVGNVVTVVAYFSGTPASGTNQYNAFSMTLPINTNSANGYGNIVAQTIGGIPSACGVVFGYTTSTVYFDINTNYPSPGTGFVVSFQYQVTI